MNGLRQVAMAAAFAASLAAGIPRAQGAESPPDDPRGLTIFEKRIRPALVQYCYGCHSAQAGEPKGGLLVDSRDGLLEGGESGAAVVPGNPDDSLLLEALRHDGLEMPPDRKLPDDLIADFETWIELGAPDPRRGKPSGLAGKIDIEEGRKFWAYQPVADPIPPTPKNAEWARDAIDRFLLTAMESEGLRPVRDADRRTLLRRLSFDLTGLPPTPEELDAFEKDQSPRALESVVDRLLESPRFGERWGRHWLDVARYAESNGNTDNVTFPHAWRYRDYVVEAFNRDKPFDRFLVEQVAGDLLAADSPAQRDEQLIATGFLALGSKPRAQNNPDYEMDLVAEQIEVTTTSFMALTVACARCHDHKFDPIPIEEYYAMAGIFTSTATLYSNGGGKGNGRLPKTGFHAISGARPAPASGDTASGDSPSGDTASQFTVAGTLAKLREERATLETRLKRLGAEIVVSKAGATGGGQNNAKGKGKGKKKAAKQAAAPAGKPVARVMVPGNVSDQNRRRIANLESLWRSVVDQIEALDDSVAGPAESQAAAMGVRDARQVSDCKLCLRGDSQKRGPAVPRGLVSVISTSSAVKIPADQSGRLQLAQWMASPDHPLTARVYVNRVWKHLFGRGLVPSVDNFGVLGEKPSHPELLDHVARRFMQDGWSTKRLIRTLVLTRAYGLSSRSDPGQLEKDPDNVYHWRHVPTRLDAEAMRDTVLAVSGTLQADPPRGSMVSSFGEQVVQGKKREIELGIDQLRYRSVYLPILRNALPEVLELFDGADPSLVVGARDVTTVPSQSLYLLNSPFVVEQSRGFAQRLIAELPQGGPQRVQRAFQLAFGRAATEDEVQQVASLVRRAAGGEKGPSGEKTPLSELDGWACFTQALLASAEFRYVY